MIIIHSLRQSGRRRWHRHLRHRIRLRISFQHMCKHPCQSGDPKDQPAKCIADHRKGHIRLNKRDSQKQHCHHQKPSRYHPCICPEDFLSRYIFQITALLQIFLHALKRQAPEMPQDTDPAKKHTIHRKHRIALQLAVKHKDKTLCDCHPQGIIIPRPDLSHISDKASDHK